MGRERQAEISHGLVLLLTTIYSLHSSNHLPLQPARLHSLRRTPFAPAGSLDRKLGRGERKVWDEKTGS
ncbi:hypothetical protein CPSG_08380 [Coccidioides posadasii str. Silveira]|uniref:Uncharacterized protein n=1 Tax=Coccidioides posadasii (strain RMSCC 757 / Silveira) TaxID=443226 RepID=E9DEY0_COCPS|nr:hypothetical protein CPSG_08380 [Coccidioides posadasii str. Silveira]